MSFCIQLRKLRRPSGPAGGGSRPSTWWGRVVDFGLTTEVPVEREMVGDVYESALGAPTWENGGLPILNRSAKIDSNFIINKPPR